MNTYMNCDSLEVKTSTVDTAGENIIKIETNIDNMNPEFYGDLLENILTMGAKDTWLTPIIMKKGRPAVMLSILCADTLLQEMARYVFTNTTSIGIRYTPFDRIICDRFFKKIEINDTIVHKKIATYEDVIVNESYEYEDLRKLASKNNCSIKKAESLVRKFESCFHEDLK